MMCGGAWARARLSVDESMKSSMLKFSFLLLIAVGAVATACSPRASRPVEQQDRNVEASTVPLELGVWQDEMGKTYTVEHIKQWMEPFYDAGIRNFYICATVEMMKRYVQAARSLRGAKVHAWMFALNACHDTATFAHPGWFEVNRLGQNSLDHPPYTKIYRWLSPAVPAARAWVKRKAEAYAGIAGLESVHLDFIRFNDRFLGRYSQERYFHIDQKDIEAQYDFGYHPMAVARFKKEFGYSPLDLSAPGLSPEWNQFRMDEVTSLVNEIAASVHARHKRLTAAVFPFPERARMMVLQDWPCWNVDAVVAMNYQHFYKERLEWNRFSVEAGLQETRHRNRYIAGIYVGNLDASQIYKVAAMDIEAGADGINFFDANRLKQHNRLAMVQRIHDELGGR